MITAEEFVSFVKKTCYERSDNLEYKRNLKLYRQPTPAIVTMANWLNNLSEDDITKIQLLMKNISRTSLTKCLNVLDNMASGAEERYDLDCVSETSEKKLLNPSDGSTYFNTIFSNQVPFFASDNNENKE